MWLYECRFPTILRSSLRFWAHAEGNFPADVSGGSYSVKQSPKGN